MDVYEFRRMDESAMDFVRRTRQDAQELIAEALRAMDNPRNQYALVYKRGVISFEAALSATLDEVLASRPDAPGLSGVISHWER